MRRRLRYFRLFGLMTTVFLAVSSLYWAARRSSAPQDRPAPFPSFSSAPMRYRVVVAAQDLPPYTLVTPDSVTVRTVETPPPDSVFSDPQQVVQRLTRIYIRAGEVVRSTDVTPPLHDGALASVLPPGTVGMALTIPRREQVPPIRPGDALRIYAVFSRTKIQPVAMRALVLTVNDRSAAPEEAGAAPPSSSPNNPPPTLSASPNAPAQRGASLTLLIAVPPEEARAIALAMDSGATLYYALLPPPPLTPMAEQSLSLRELSGLALGGDRLAPTPRASSSRAPKTPPVSQRLAPPRFVLPSPVVAPPVIADRPVTSPAPSKPPDLKRSTTAPVQPMHQIVGVVGDRPVILTVPAERKEGER